MILHAIDYNGGEIWVDKDVNIEEGKLFIHPNKVIESASRTLDGRGLSKIIAQSHNLSLPNIPYVEVEEDVEQIADKHVTEGIWGYPKDSPGEFMYRNLKEVFIDGYKAASAKKWTDEDLMKAIDMAQEYKGDYGDFDRFIYTPKQIIKSLQPKVISIEVEATRTRFPKGDDGWEDIYTPVTYTKELNGKMETFLKVKSVNYNQ